MLSAEVAGFGMWELAAPSCFDGKTSRQIFPFQAQDSTMKMTLVVDTEDIKGLEAAYKMVTTMCRQYDVRVGSSSSEKRFGKIAFIKALRAYMKQQMDGVEHGEIKFEDMRSLRGAKHFADRIYIDGWKPLI